MRASFPVQGVQAKRRPSSLHNLHLAETWLRDCSTTLDRIGGCFSRFEATLSVQDWACPPRSACQEQGMQRLSMLPS